MPKPKRLKPEDREFFSLLADVIFSNPFSTAREHVETVLGQRFRHPVHDDEHHYSLMIPPLDHVLDKLEKRGIDRIQAVTGEDRTPLEHAFLFQIYHRFADAFDDLIQRQIKQKDHPVDVPFAPDLITQLDQRGFDARETQRYIALFYQLRRAHFFIAHSLVGDSPSMKKLRHDLWNNVFTTDVRAYARHFWDRMEDFSTLILGETGTGKGAAAAAIGRSGLIPFDMATGCFTDSFLATFTACNLSQFPESLIESELFGHRKGAFTGAIDNHKGLFERCSAHGSLFLDEIGDVSVPVQIKLLNVIQNRHFTPVGSHKALRFDGRVIAATNQPMAALRQQGRFRDDFYYRLSSDVIEMPTLRQRLQESPDELPQLAGLLLQRMSGENSAQLTDQVIASLQSSLPVDYAWPGNVRELEQAIRRILLTGEYRSEPPSGKASDWLQNTARGNLTAQDLLAHYCLMLYRQHGTYDKVAELTELDWRTAKKYIQAGLDLP
jgi:DNA-binding NtrC family response regulator